MSKAFGMRSIAFLNYSVRLQGAAGEGTFEVKIFLLRKIILKKSGRQRSREKANGREPSQNAAKRLQGDSIMEFLITVAIILVIALGVRMILSRRQYRRFEKEGQTAEGEVISHHTRMV
jgi:hypothetical protein